MTFLSSTTYFVDQSTEGTLTRGESGNRVDGSYSKSNEAEDTYEVEQTGSGDHNFT